MTHAGLFSGIGGFSLAAQWMGWENVFDVEIDAWCRKVLHKNFPTTQLFADVCTFDGLPFRGTIDVLSGGFPCQPWSNAGRQLGTEDPRHLWPQFLRIIREVQPGNVVGENVRGLLSWGGGLQFDAVCADLEAEGYEVLPFLLPAASVGAPHHRDRFWFVAHARRFASPGRQAAQHGSQHNRPQARWQENTNILSGLREAGVAADAVGQCLQVGQVQRCHASQEQPPATGAAWRLTEPPLCGPNDGLPARLVRTTSPRAKQLKAYGNAIVPQVALQIFQAIAAASPSTLPQ